MKRIILCAVMVCALVPLLSAQVLDKPAATFRLTKTESITVSLLQKSEAEFEAQLNRPLTLDERKQLLDNLINTRLLLQAAARDNVVVSEVEMKAALADYQNRMGQARFGRGLSDAELQDALRANHMTYEAYQNQIRDQQTQIDYIRKLKPAAFDIPRTASDQDIQDFYDKHVQNYSVGTMVTLKHIFFDTQSITVKEERDKVAKLADEVLKKLKGGASFADLLLQSDDAKSKYKGGQFATFFRNDPRSEQLYGAAFCDAIFKLKKGETSGVLQSNLGFHIVQVTDRVEARLLSLDDQVPPDNTRTVKQSINDAIVSQRQQESLKSALTDIFSDLRKKAEVKIFDDNIS